MEHLLLFLDLQTGDAGSVDDLRYRMAHLTANCPVNEKFVMFVMFLTVGRARPCLRPAQSMRK
ncbi:hypothetical protein CO659_24820 [Rhizobium sp. S9]|nr:hypothetical protein CO659_24820 [Rhizobium sp. S9]